MRNKFFILFFLGVICMFFWFRIVDLNEVFNHYNSINFYYLVLFFVFLFFATVVRGLRWSFLLKKLVNIKRIDVIKVYAFGSVVDFIIPIRISELIKANFVKKKYNIPISKSFSSISIDKLFDLAPIFLILIVLPFYAKEISLGLIFVFIFLLGCIFLGLFFVFFLLYKFDLIVKLRFNSKKKLFRKVLTLLIFFIIGIHRLNLSFSFILKLSFLSLLAIFFNCLVFYFAVLSLGYSMNLQIVLVGFSLLFLSYAVPSPPAQLGSNELIGTLIFSGIFGYDKNFIGAMIFYSHTLAGLFILAMGIYLLATFKKEFFASFLFKN